MDQLTDPSMIGFETAVYGGPTQRDCCVNSVPTRGAEVPTASSDYCRQLMERG